MRSYVRSITAAALLALSVGSVAQAAPPAVHPIRQLVQWEVGANAAIDRDALLRYAGVVVRQARPEDLPADIRPRSPSGSGWNFRFWQKPKAAPAWTLKDLRQLSDDELRRLAAVPVPIQYYEIPLDDLNETGKTVFHSLPGAEADVASRALYFERDGKKYVRWFLHPLADNPPVERFVERINSLTGAKLTPKTGPYRAHFTASRSLIIFEGNYQNAFSLKVSLPNAPGNFPDKAVKVAQLKAWSSHGQYLDDVLGAGELPTLRYQYESLSLGVTTPSYGSARVASEDGWIARSLGPLTIGDRYYLPAFAAMNEKVGKEIAALNGVSDPAEYWRKHLAEPLGAAMAELQARTGERHTSPHSQNFLVELDSNFKPTGKIILRDSDFYADQKVFSILNRVVPADRVSGLTEVLDDAVLREQFSLRNGLRDFPSWLTPERYGQWVQSYFTRFGTRYSELTGLDLKPELYRVLNGTMMTKMEDDYFQKNRILELLIAQYENPGLGARRESLAREARAVLEQTPRVPCGPHPLRAARERLGSE